jgi:hypothetical protein
MLSGWAFTHGSSCNTQRSSVDFSAGAAVVDALLVRVLLLIIAAVTAAATVAAGCRPCLSSMSLPQASRCLTSRASMRSARQWTRSRPV